MSVKENRCRKFQGNIFHQSKCQNCFQPRESHLLNDEDLSQAKPIYGGWLLLAPEGSHLDRPFHRTRKWQRRFFVLYEHGLLRYALDDLPTTLPQGSIDMNRCCDVTDGESRTAHENSLCILTPEKEHFLRAECKTSINGWQEALSVYPRTNKQNQKKKRKVEPPTRQEPGPAKVTVTSGASADGIPRLPGGIAGAERVPMGRATSWREENRRSRPTAPWSRSASFLGRPERSQMGSTGATQDDGGAMSAGRKVRVESAYFSLEKTKSEPSPKPAQISLPPRQLSPSTSSSSAGPEAPLSASPLPPCELYSAIGSSLDGEPDDETPSREGRRAAAGGSVASATRGGAGAALSDVPPARGMPSREASASEKKPRDLRARTQSPGREEVARLFGEERRRWQVIVRFEESPNAERMDTSGRSEPSSNVNDAQRRGRRSGRRDLSDRCDARSDAGKERRVPDAASGSAFANLGRAKSLERRVGESATTPDLLDFKKGWLSKLNDHGTWKKHWFVLTDQSLRYYKDSLAEEASEADGEIHLSACCDVQEFPVPRNYGFRILCQGGACTLSAMTSGIRRNWIQAIANNARSAVAPDVTRSVPEVNPQGRAEPEPSPRPEPPDGRPWPSGGNGASAPPSEPRKSRLGESRREGRSKTLDRSAFQIDETGEPAKEPADAVDRSPSLSTPASCCSSPSSSSSSPVRPHPTSPIEDDVSPPPNTLLPKSPVRPSLPQSPERGRMRVDRPSAPRHVEGEKLSVASSAKEEIEQRWLQVETTPLREEKQVAIAASSEDADGPPPCQLAALLDNELGQKQKVLEQLQRQNSKLQEQLGDALGREESARDGYVPQSAAAPPSSSSSPRRVPRQAWHKLNRDLRSASESPKRKRVLDPQPIQTLERNSAEGRTAPDHHREAHVVAPRSSASEEILASERAVARMRNELHLERDPSKEREEEYARTRATLRARLEDGQSRLREAEDSLLERSRALRHLERQRALRPDHTGEVQSLRERLREVTACLLASQQGRALKEQHLREEQRGVGESHRTERQSPRPRRAEAQAAREQTEAERHGEAPLGGRRGSAARARGEELPQPRQELAPKSGALESLRESVRRLQEEKGPLTRRCRQLLDQIALADGELGELCGRLQTEEAHYCSLEKSYERATRDFERMSQLLREKDREILRAEGTYRSLLERKEEDLKEALVKMSALGNSLEETERELRAKEDLLSQMSRRPSCRVEAAAAQPNLKAEPALAEKRVAELRRHPDALRPGNAHLHSKRKRGRGRESHPTTAALTSDGESPLSFGAASRTEDSADDDDDDDESPGDWRSFDDARNQQDSDLAQALAGDSDKLISIVHALETKLLATEEKLKCLTGTLREHRQTHASNRDPKTVANEPRGCESVPGIAAATAAYAEATAAYAEALLCVETSRQKVETFLADSRQLRSLAEVPHQLFRASAHIRRGQKTSEEQWPRRPATQIWELFQQEAAPLFAQTLSLEALVLDQMAALLRTPESDLLLRTLTAIWEDVENIPSGDHDCLAEVYAHVLTRKWTLESVRWEAPEREAPPRGGGSNEADAGAEAAVNASAIFNALVEAELSYSVGNLKLGYREKLRLLEGELAEGRRQLSPRGAASEAILEASEGARLKSAIREAKADFGSGPPTSAAVCPPELAPYAEQIEWQEARRLAEKVAERRLADKMPPCAVDPAESLRSARESLAVELRQQAAKLREYAQEIQSAGGRPQLAQTLGAVLGPRASRRFTGASLCMREALVQSQVAYVACRLRAARKSTSARRRETRRSADALVGRRPGSVGAVREKYEYETERGALEREMDRLSKRQERGGHFQMQAEERERREDSLSEGAADGRQRPKEDPPAVKERHRNGVKKLKDDFERQIAPIRRIRRDEVVGSRSAPGQSLAKLPADGSRRRVASSSPTEAGERRAVSEGDAAALLKDRIRQPEAQMNAMRDEVDDAHPEGHVSGLRLKSQRDLESLKATCERGFAAMEESHHKVVRDLQRQHRREISKLTEERERLLAEETAATVAAIEAMKNAHEEELEKNRRSQLSGLDADIDQLRLQYQEELRSIQRELEVLSEQYSQKCLENAHLARALEAERQALGRCRRENRELHAHNQELNDRLRAEIARMRSRLGGETAPSPATPGKDVYELEVLLRVKESEIRYLKREIHSLKDELQSALRDEKYAADKRKDLHSELSVAKAKADCEIGKLKEKLHIATRALGDRSVSSGYDVTKSKSNPDLMEKEQTTTSEPSGSVGSKSLKEGLTVQERMKLFQAKESEKI